MELEVELDDLDVELRVDGRRSSGSIESLGVPLDGLRLGIITPPTGSTAQLIVDDVALPVRAAVSRFRSASRDPI